MKTTVTKREEKPRGISAEELPSNSFAVVVSTPEGSAVDIGDVAYKAVLGDMMYFPRGGFRDSTSKDLHRYEPLAPGDKLVIEI